MLRATTTGNFSFLIWPPASAPHKSLEKHSAPRLSHLFAHLDLLSSETFSFLIFFLLLFSLSDSSHLCFSSVHIVGSLTSKLPSIIYMYMYVHTHIYIYIFTVEGSLEVKLPTIWTDEKQSRAEAERRERLEERRVEEKEPEERRCRCAKR